MGDWAKSILVISCLFILTVFISQNVHAELVLFKIPSDQPSLPDIFDVAIDGSGNIVATFFSGGLVKFDQTGSEIFNVNGDGTPFGEFSNPMGVGIDPSGNVYVADRQNVRIVKFDSSGNFLLEFGQGGSGAGDFSGPEDIASDSSGNVYVVEAGNHRVQKFNSMGVFQSMFGWGVDTGAAAFQTCTSSCQSGLSGSGDGQFNAPTNIFVDISGNIWISETNNHRVQKFDTSGFDSSGNFLLKFGRNGGDGTSGSGNGEFNFPEGIGGDSSGNIFVADSLNNRIQKFDSSGSFLSEFGSVGDANGEFAAPRGVDLDSSNNIFVADGNNNRVQKFNSAGGFLDKFGSHGTEQGLFADPWKLDVDFSGNILVVDTNNERVQKFDSTGGFLLEFGTDGNGDGEFQFPRGIGVDNSANIYVADTGNHIIQKFDSTGTFIGWMGKCTSGINCDVGNQRSNGFSCNDIDCSGSGTGSADGQFFNPADVKISPNGIIYVADDTNSRVQKFDSSGNHIQSIGSFCGLPTSGGSGSGCVDPDGGGPLDLGDGQFWGPQGVAPDASENVYVADTFNDRIQKFDSSGNFVSKFGKNGGDGSPGLGDGEFFGPRGVAVDSSGNIYVVDRDRFQKFDSSGNFVSTFGQHGTDIDELSSDPRGIVVDSSAIIYVADTRNSRILVLTQTCLPPISEDWDITENCTLETSDTAPENVIVQNGAVLTIPAGLTLDIDFASFNLTVKSGSGVLIESGGAVT